MGEKFWIAKAYNAQGKEQANGPAVKTDAPSTMKDASDWAKNILGSMPQVTRVVLFEAMAEVIRESPPISIVPLSDDPQLKRVCNDLAA